MIGHDPTRGGALDSQTFGSSEDWAGIRAPPMKVGEAAMAIQLSDALGVTGLDWDEMVDLVRERSMLARVREAWGDDAICTERCDAGWFVTTGDGCRITNTGTRLDPGEFYATEREALDVALECKP